LIKAWKIGFSDARIPNPKEIESLLKLIDADQIQLDEEKKTVKLAKNMELDLGSLAKGFIADLIITELKSKGATSGLINLGGNIVTFGTPKNQNREKWHIALRNPEGTRDDFKLILKVQDKSVVTSGIYERVLKKDGEKFHHIFDSKTGYPLKTDILSLTIISEKSIDGEIWTTRLYGKEATRIIAEVNELKIIEAIVVTKNQIFYSDGIKEFL
jgi:thiamine biosynthesis lipoprotein